MTLRALPPELSALVHHVELTKAGWREATLELVIKSLLTTDVQPQDYQSINESVTTALGESVGIAKTTSICDRLISRGEIVRLPDHSLKLGESVRHEVAACASEVQELELRVAAHFASLAARVEGLPISWERFKDGFVLPLVETLGARTYEIISGRDSSLENHLAAREFLNSFDEEVQTDVRTLMSDFLGSQNEDVRSYILGNLHAVFLIQAIALSEETVSHISASASKNRTLVIFCDTNFIFSLIGLHENPSDDAADALYRLVSSLESRLKIQLFVLPITVDETKRTIGGYEAELDAISLTPMLGRALYRSTRELSGVTVKFIQASTKAQGRLNAQDYLHPFHQNLVGILRTKGIEVYNADTDSMKTDQEVIDDILDQRDHLQHQSRRPKSYQTLEHDTIWGGPGFVDRLALSVFVIEQNESGGLW